MRTEASAKSGRNDPCPCGSGDKYKHCCLVTNEALRTVLRLAKRGLRLIPVKAGEKFPPLLKAWQKHASCELDQVLSWYEKHERCNWGGTTGSTPGCFIVDADGEAGRITVAEWTNLHSDEWFKTTLAVETGNGSQYYAAWPSEVQIHNSAKKIAPGIDIRGENGYGILPPSIHPSGKPYQFLNGVDAPILPAPPWLLEKLGTTKPAGESQHANPSGFEIPDRLPEGSRDSVVHKMAAGLRRRGYPPDVIRAAITTFNLNHCVPPMAEAQVEKIYQSVIKYKAGSAVPERVATRGPDLLCLADVEPKAVSWLWRDYIPRKMLSMISGDPGCGKTWLALAIIAAFTRGRVPFSGEQIEPVDVLYLSVENVPDCVIRPRLDVLEGDPGRFHLLRGYECGEERGGIRLDDVEVLEGALQQTRAKLVVVDPIQSYLAGIDTHRANETRPVLDVLAKLADQFDCGILLLRHLTKASAGRAMYRGLGSIDFTGAVRTELLAGIVPDLPSSRALVSVKSNVGPPAPSLAYEIQDAGDTGVFRWTGPVDVSAADLVADDKPDAGTRQADAVEFLRHALARGERPTKEVEKHAKECGISPRTLTRARQILKVAWRTEGFGKGSKVLIRLRTPQAPIPFQPDEESEV